MLARHAAMAICFVMSAMPALAGPTIPSSVSRLIEGRLSTQYASREPEISVKPAQDPFRETAPRYTGSYSGSLRPMAEAAARRHGVPTHLFLKLVETESNWKPRAKSRVGAIGLAQLMPDTARYLGVRDPWDPEQNLDGGARYLAEQYREFRSWPLALAAYNAGPQAVKRHGGVPPYNETRNYVKRILGK